MYLGSNEAGNSILLRLGAICFNLVIRLECAEV